MNAIHTLRAVYEAAPTPVKRLVAPVARALPTRFRYGRAFSETRSLLLARDGGTLDIDAEVRRRLADLHAAAMRTPFWASRLREAGLATGLVDPGALSALPLLDKETVRANGADMLDPACPERARKWVTTGGTTSAQLGLWIDRDSSAADWAFVVDAWSRVGFALDERRAVFRGVRLGHRESRRMFEYEPLRRELYFSVFDMDDEGMRVIRSRLSRFAPRYLHGYPSALETLAKGYLAAGEQPPQFEALLCVSEMVYPAQRELFARVFGCRVFGFYGMTEKAAFAAECEHSAELHVDPLYGVVELVDPETGEIVERPGATGEVVVTGLLSRSMPLMRYRTGDLARWADGSCACGRPMRRLAALEGRWGREALIGATGARIPMSAVNVHSAIFDRVRSMRFYQDCAGMAELRLVPGPGYGPSDAAAIANEMAARLGGQVTVGIREVREIPLSPRGKHEMLEQHIPGADE